MVPPSLPPFPTTPLSPLVPPRAPAIGLKSKLIESGTQDHPYMGHKLAWSRLFEAFFSVAAGSLCAAAFFLSPSYEDLLFPRERVYERGFSPPGFFLWY